MTLSEVEILLESFKSNPYPRKEDKDQLAESLDISRKKIDLCFNYMRVKKLREGVLKKSE